MTTSLRIHAPSSLSPRPALRALVSVIMQALALAKAEIDTMRMTIDPKSWCHPAWLIPIGAGIATAASPGPLQSAADLLPKLAVLLDKTAAAGSRPLTVTMVGSFSCGKSAFLSSLLAGPRQLAAGVMPGSGHVLPFYCLGQLAARERNLDESFPQEEFSLVARPPEEWGEQFVVIDECGSMPCTHPARRPRGLNERFRGRRHGPVLSLELSCQPALGPDQALAMTALAFSKDAGTVRLAPPDGRNRWNLALDAGYARRAGPGSIIEYLDAGFPLGEIRSIAVRALRRLMSWRAHQSPTLAGVLRYCLVDGSARAAAASGFTAKAGSLPARTALPPGRGYDDAQLFADRGSAPRLPGRICTNAAGSRHHRAGQDACAMPRHGRLLDASPRRHGRKRLPGLQRPAAGDGSRMTGCSIVRLSPAHGNHVCCAMVATPQNMAISWGKNGELCMDHHDARTRETQQPAAGTRLQLVLPSSTGRRPGLLHSTGGPLGFSPGALADLWACGRSQ
jgi:hypothetical protein